MKISVIVAAYNAEKYLSETLESILHQTIDDYEVIVVNDGSKDGTRNILETYSKSYDRLRVIDQENGGPSAARNTGLNAAQGDYIFFFDADDILECDALESLYDAAQSHNADLVIAKYDIFNKYKTVQINNINDLVVQDKIDKYNLMILWTFSLWNKLFKRKLIEKYHFRFPSLSYSEDGAFLMEYVYHTEKITGLDKVVCHYRKMYDGGTEAITATVSPVKVRDYISAHNIIFDSARSSFLKDYTEYESIEEAIQQNRQISRYFSEITRKELQILINQFYVKFWDLDQDTLILITDEMQSRMKNLDVKSVALLMDSHPDLSLFHLSVTHDDMMGKAFCTAVLYGDNNNEKDFLHCLESLILQNLVAMKIVVPEKMKSKIQSSGLMRENIIFLQSLSEKELFKQALDMADSRYITFCDPKIVYANNAFRYVFKRFIKFPLDFISELIYHTNYGDPQPVFFNQMAFDSLTTGIEYTPYICMDDILANKFFNVDFLRRQQIKHGIDFADYRELLWRESCNRYYDDGIVFYEDKENTFPDYIGTDEAKKVAEECIRDNPITLNSVDIMSDFRKSLPKLQDLPDEKIHDRFLKNAVTYYMKKDLKDRVLFFSIRKDGELEGNAKALYPYIKGEKLICARQLPHNEFIQYKMFEKIITSKVIVTDDYVRYLRHFPLRPEQRVIQLWHGCGAFKKFGKRGTNISLTTDKATHAQYNLVAVSGEYIRPIYADAFDIDIKKVKALGCPRTDDFFNEDLIKEIRKRIYDRYPELKDKFVIIYAPTFRDIGNDRTQFYPELDFDKLSRELLPDQEFIVCPHPLMRNRIVPKDYPNIHVMRDFSTNELMFISNMLITDYSSVIFEYALLKKPIVFFCYDLPVYNRGFFLNYPDDLPGDVFETQDELISYLQNPKRQVVSEKYEAFVRKYMSACDGHSCERIAKLINDYMEEK